MRIYVGNLSYETNESDITREFQAFGAVASVNVITDKVSGRSKGFGFVEMGIASEAQAAIAGLNGKMLNGRTINVNEARSRSDDRGGSSGPRREGGYGRGPQRGY